MTLVSSLRFLKDICAFFTLNDLWSTVDAFYTLRSLVSVICGGRCWNSVFNDALDMWCGISIVVFGRFDHCFMMCIVVIADDGPVNIVIFEDFGHIGTPLIDRDSFRLRILERKMIFIYKACSSSSSSSI